MRVLEVKIDRLELRLTGVTEIEARALATQLRGAIESELAQQSLGRAGGQAAPANGLTGRVACEIAGAITARTAAPQRAQGGGAP